MIWSAFGGSRGGKKTCSKTTFNIREANPNETNCDMGENPVNSSFVSNKCMFLCKPKILEN